MKTNYYKVLGKSTMFHMSLGSKELFHSNFLHWISIVNWDAFLQIMRGLANTQEFWWEDNYSPANNNLEVRREYHNFDLSIYILDDKEIEDNSKPNDDTANDNVVYCDGKRYIQKWIPVLILENKMKSLPYKKQLDNYVEKATREWFSGRNAEKIINNTRKNPNKERTINFILLSLMEPSLNDYKFRYTKESKRPKYKVTVEGEWKHKTYEELLTLIKQSWQGQSQCLNDKIIDDYCNFIGALCGLAKEWKVVEKDPYIKTICEGGSEEKKLRIHDIREKIHYEQMLKMLEDKLGGKVMPFERFDKAKLKGTGLPIIATNISYAHGIGLFEVQYIVDDEWVLFIQVQGNRYCHMIGNNKKKQIVQISNSNNQPTNLDSKFGFFININNSKPQFPAKVGRPDLNKYGRYKENMIYQWCEIPNDCTIGDVIEAMCDDLGNIKKNLP